jgi:DNA (cytosine-5)-methyltransferase 1
MSTSTAGIRLSSGPLDMGPLGVRGRLSVLEICAGAGGQSIGLERAGFDHSVAVEIDANACATLRLNRPHWDVRQVDVRTIDGRNFRGVDLVAGGVPCPPFSIAGKQLGADDERDLFPEAIRLVREAAPKAVMLENVRGFASPRFLDYRKELFREFDRMGYQVFWRVLNASDFQVPQLRPRFLLVAMRQPHAADFRWPDPITPIRTVGETIGDLMGEHGWPGTPTWIGKANGVAPTIVGGSKKHGGPDLGPTRARQEWLKLGVDGRGIANSAPGADTPDSTMPRLTVRMVARLQAFPDSWEVSGGKTASYRQVGNAFPPAVAAVVGRAIRDAITGTTETSGQMRFREAQVV